MLLINHCGYAAIIKFHPEDLRGVRYFTWQVTHRTGHRNMFSTTDIPDS